MRKHTYWIGLICVAQLMVGNRAHAFDWSSFLSAQDDDEESIEVPTAEAPDTRGLETEDGPPPTPSLRPLFLNIPVQAPVSRGSQPDTEESRTESGSPFTSTDSTLISPSVGNVATQAPAPHGSGNVASALTSSDPNRDIFVHCTNLAPIDENRYSLDESRRRGLFTTYPLTCYPLNSTLAPFSVVPSGERLEIYSLVNSYHIGFNNAETYGYPTYKIRIGNREVNSITYINPHSRLIFGSTLGRPDQQERERTDHPLRTHSMSSPTPLLILGNEESVEARLFISRRFAPFNQYGPDEDISHALYLVDLWGKLVTGSR